MSESDPREREVVALLKQLSSGLSAYRLYPGNPDQPAFKAAVSRIRSAADMALIQGTIVVEVQGDRFHMGMGPLADDESLKRLALACYDRRTDRIRIRSIPEAHELVAVYEALSAKVEDVAAIGGVGAMISEAGVTSISMIQVELLASENQIPDGLSTEQAAMWERIQHGEDLLGDTTEGAVDAADTLYTRFRELVAALPEEVAEDPELYRRLQGSMSELPEETRRQLSSMMFDHIADDQVAQRVIGTMTDADLARTLTEIAQTGGHDPVEMAQGLVNSGLRRDDNVVNMTKAALQGSQEAGTIIPPHAGLLGEGGTEGPGGPGTSAGGGAPGLGARGGAGTAVGHVTTRGGVGGPGGAGSGPSPGVVPGGSARSAGNGAPEGGLQGFSIPGLDETPDESGQGRRRGKGPMLFKGDGAGRRGQAAHGQKGALGGLAMSAPSQVSTPRLTETVSDLLGQELKLSEHEDSLAIRAEFPTTADDHNNLAMEVAEDYLGLEEDFDRLDKVLDIWSTEARDALRRGDLDHALRLVKVARRAGRRSTQRGNDVESLFQAYRRRVLDSRLLRDMIQPGRDQQKVLDMLAPFGADAVDALLDLLSEEEDRTKRAALLNILSHLAKDYRQRVIDRVSDHRWYVVRNAVIILYRSGAGTEIAPHLEKATRHEHPAVRREALRGLVPVMGANSMPHLHRLVKDPDDSVRGVAVGLLGDINTPIAVAALVDVARTADDRALRRQALDELSKHPSPDSAKTLAQLASFRSHPRLPWSLRRYARSVSRRRGEAS